MLRPEKSINYDGNWKMFPNLQRLFKSISHRSSAEGNGLSDPGLSMVGMPGHRQTLFIDSLSVSWIA